MTPGRFGVLSALVVALALTACAGGSASTPRETASTVTTVRPTTSVTVPRPTTTTAQSGGAVATGLPEADDERTPLTVARLATARARWRALRTNTYEWRVQVGCFCAAGAYDVKVTNGAATEVRVVDGGHTPSEGGPADGLTVERVFDEMDAGIRKGTAVVASFDPDRWFPITVSIASPPGTSDAEVGYRTIAMAGYEPNVYGSVVADWLHAGSEDLWTTQATEGGPFRRALVTVHNPDASTVVRGTVVVVFTGPSGAVVDRRAYPLFSMLPPGDTPLTVAGSITSTRVSVDVIVAERSSTSPPRVRVHDVRLVPPGTEGDVSSLQVVGTVTNEGGAVVDDLDLTAVVTEGSKVLEAGGGLSTDSLQPGASIDFAISFELTDVDGRDLRASVYVTQDTVP